MNSTNYLEPFNKMSNNLDLFVDEVKRKDSRLMATDKWTVKEILCHIVFWHMNYAENYQALSLGKHPALLNGPLYKINLIGVYELKENSINNLINLLFKANEILYQSIVVKKVPKMTYKENGKVLATDKFLHLIERHLYTHTQQVRKAKVIQKI